MLSHAIASLYRICKDICCMIHPCRGVVGHGLSIKPKLDAVMGRLLVVCRSQTTCWRVCSAKHQCINCLHNMFFSEPVPGVAPRLAQCHDNVASLKKISVTDMWFRCQHIWWPIDYGLTGSCRWRRGEL